MLRGRTTYIRDFSIRSPVCWDNMFVRRRVFVEGTPKSCFVEENPYLVGVGNKWFKNFLYSFCWGEKPSSGLKKKGVQLS